MKDKKYIIQYYDGIYRCWRDLPRLTYDDRAAAHEGAKVYQIIMNRTVRVKEIKND